MEHGYSLYSWGCGRYSLLYYGLSVFEGSLEECSEQLAGLLEVLELVEPEEQVVQ